MADPPKYRVIMSGVVLPEKSRDQVIEQLAALFHSSRDTMEKLLRGRATPLTREYERAEAEKVCRAIRAAGAECGMEEIAAADAAPAQREAVVAPQPGPRDPAAEAAGQARRARARGAGGERQAAGDGDKGGDGDVKREAAMLRFVAVNTDYYRRQFAKFGDLERPSFALTWHWPAFLLFFFWAVYRKLWLWAGVNLVGGVALALLARPGVFYLAWALFWPLTANYLYFRHVRARVLAGADAAPGETAPDPRGGVSRRAVWLGVIVMFLLSAILNDLFTERMLERYSERYAGRVGDVLSQPGTRRRGDGASIDDLTGLEPGVARTVNALGVLAAALKLAASEHGLDDGRLAVSVLERVIERRTIPDAWGRKIALRQDAAGQVVLVSAGPDGLFDNEDDILQYIHLENP